MRTNIRYILLTALRDRLFLGMLAGVIAAAFISATLGGTAMVESRQMTIAFAAASTRVILAIGLIVFVCFHIRHAFDSKEIDVFLSRPISRANLIISYWLGFAAVSLLLVVPSAAIIWWIGAENQEGFFYWSASLWAESLIVVAMSLFAAFLLGSAVSAVLSGLAFYVLARMMAFFVATTDSGMLFREGWVNELLTGTLKYISIIIPRLDFFAKTDWLIYGVRHGQELVHGFTQAMVFVPLLIAVTIVDFHRKEF